MSMSSLAQPNPALPAPLVTSRGRWTRRRVFALALTLGLAVGAAFVVRAVRRAPAPTARYETTPVTRGPLEARVTASGNLSALVTVQVGSQVSGRVQQLLVDYNSPVRKGQLVAVIDPKLFAAAAEQAKANHVAATANVDKARVQLADADRQAGRLRALWDRKVVARADVDAAETNLGVAKALVVAADGAAQQTRAALHQAQINLAYTRIASPIDGVVISRNVDVGQTVAAALQSPTLFVIAEDLRKMQVDTSVAEADVGKLRAGMAAQFTVDAYPAKVFRGVIREVRNAPQTIQNVVTYDAVLDVDNGALELKPGMTANVTVVYAARKDVLRIPNAAMRFRPTGETATAARTTADAVPMDARAVWVLRAGQPERRMVRVGVTDGISTEVVSGEIHVGDALVTEMTGAAKSGPGTFGRVL
ncbi:MAG TPA: efflux RND transporter periplasmic adaptor subunit [Polyangia bacterium]|nr:efflux RND transporter periplasmic adaptor subunit [Polyangia bacterium]